MRIPFESEDLPFLLETAFALPGIGVGVTDARGIFTYVNSSFCRIFGYTEDELHGSSFLLLIAEENREEGKELFNSSFTREEKTSRIWHGKSKSGKPVSILATAANFTASGNTPYRITIVNDVTDIMLLRKRLELSEKVFANTKDGIMITDDKPEILKVNNAFTEITGYREEDVIGKDPGIIKSGNHDEDFYKRMWESIKVQGYWQGEIWDRKKNGENYAQFLSISAAYDIDGKVSNYIGIMNDITAVKRFRDRIHYLAYYNSLTDLPNRALFQDRLHQALGKSKRTKRKTVICFINLDRFNVINQSFSHTTGDEVLKKVAARLKNDFTFSETVSYFGADTFVLLLENILTTSSIVKTVSEVLSILRKPITVNDIDLQLTGSIGISIFPDDGGDGETILKNAESAQKEMKTIGGDGYQFYSKEMNAASLERLRVENDLRKALERNELFLLYQPQISMDTGVLVGAEALLRWKHPERGIVSPVEFIPVAEETGLIIAIGRWVLFSACSLFKQWLDRGIDRGRVAINLSAVQFAHLGIIDMIREILFETGLPGEKVEIEITESAIMRNVEESIIILKQLKDLGIQLSVDDFGTGYSSLSYLKKFPIDKLKVDRSFIKDLPDDPEDRIISQTIIQLAHNLRLSAIAEGVETKEQLDFIKELGCNEVQGYFYSPPIPPDQLAVFEPGRLERNMSRS